jgi:ABC-type dipeptide/oligopeptide/nickel transport system permease subunit
MIADSQQYMFQSPWTPLVTGLAIVLTVLAFNFLGDEIRDALDPSATAGL